MSGAAGCGDLRSCGRATQVAGDGAAHADRLMLSEGVAENLAPLTRANPEGGALYVHRRSV
jgi:hypothetical protein